MTVETLQKANGLQKQIILLKDHLVVLNSRRSESGLELLLTYTNGNGNIKFKHELLPIALSDFIALYATKIAVKINELEAEFEDLED